MDYFKTDCGKLIQYNPQTDVYKQRNLIEKIDSRISKEDFNKMQKSKIKKTNFCASMNNFFKNVKHEWVYNGERFKKIDNFEASKHSVSTNYILGKDIPYHKIDGYPYYNLILVYHWGKVYYHTVSYGGYAQGQLIEPNTLQIVQWAQLKNCAPIFNINRHLIV